MEAHVQDTLRIDFYKDENEHSLILEVDVSFDLSHNGIEEVVIENIWDVSTENPKELDIKSFTQDELDDLNARIDKEMWEKQPEYEHEIYLAQADEDYDDFKDDVG